MADFDNFAPREDEDEPAPRPAGAPTPQLEEFRNIFTHPAAQKWSDEIVTILNNGFQQRRIAQENAAAGQNFADDIGQFRQGLVSMVERDPTMVHTALDLVHPTMAAIIGTMPGVENPAEHHAAITADIQHDIAHQAVTAAAEQNEPLARALLSQDRIKGVLGDSLGGLDTYTTMQANARTADDAAQQAAQARMRDDLANQSAINYLSALHDATTGQLQFPPGWNQGVISDPRLPPAAKIAVSGLYGRLQAGGDAEESNPFVISDIVHSIARGDPPHVAGVLSHAGDELRLPDALHLASLAQGKGASTAAASSMANILKTAETQLAPPENGVAGEAAFARYTNWVMDHFRNGAVSDEMANPSDPSFVAAPGRLQQFAPTPGDLAENVIHTTPGGRNGWWYRQGDNFGGSVNPDPFIPTHGRPGNENPPVRIIPEQTEQS
ncbi:MAG: hypothetical protein ACRDRB_13225 [Pseudonocardiaceae bacterium]